MAGYSPAQLAAMAARSNQMANAYQGYLNRSEMMNDRATDAALAATGLKGLMGWMSNESPASILGDVAPGVIGAIAGPAAANPLAAASLAAIGANIKGVANPVAEAAKSTAINMAMRAVNPALPAAYAAYQWGFGDRSPMTGYINPDTGYVTHNEADAPAGAIVGQWSVPSRAASAFLGRNPTLTGFKNPMTGAWEAAVQDAAPVVDANPMPVNPDYVAEVPDVAMALPVAQEAPPQAVADYGYGDTGYGDVGQMSVGVPDSVMTGAMSPAGLYGFTNFTAPVADYGALAPAATDSYSPGADGWSFGPGSDLAISNAAPPSGDSGWSGPGSLAGVPSFGGFDGIGGFGGGSDGGGKGDGGGMVICTELHRQGVMPEHIYRADQKFGLWQSDDVKQGYYLWAKPVVKLMRRSQLATRIVALFAMPWAYHMAHLMGAEKQDNRFGRFLMMTFKPVCAAMGKMLKGVRYGVV